MTEQTHPALDAVENDEARRIRKRTERLWNLGILGGFLLAFLTAGTQGAAFTVMATIVVCLLVIIVRFIVVAGARRRAKQRPPSP